MGRVLTYPQAIREATEQAMERDPSVVLLGLGVDDPKRILGTTAGLLERFGNERVFDTPLSEEGMTGVAIGMALAGLRPIHVHIRMDFLMLAMNQLVNIAAKKRYMTGGQEHVPLVVRAIIGKSWGQGAQHSQAFHSFFMHVPGIHVAAPTTPYDAKGCLLAAVRLNDPVLFVEHRLLYFQSGPVAPERYETGPGRARIVAHGEDITLVGVSHMVLECFRAHHYLKERGVRAEVIDPIWLDPLDLDTIVESVRRTGRLLVVDNGWVVCGAGSEIIASVVERLQAERDVRVGRMGFAPVPCPPTPPLEELFYPNARTIAVKAHEMVCGGVPPWCPEERKDLRTAEFRGPF